MDMPSFSATRLDVNFKVLTHSSHHNLKLHYRVLVNHPGYDSLPPPKRALSLILILCRTIPVPIPVRLTMFLKTKLARIVRSIYEKELCVLSPVPHLVVLGPGASQPTLKSVVLNLQIVTSQKIPGLLRFLNLRKQAQIITVGTKPPPKLTCISCLRTRTL